jgi:hypothetical protein
VLGSVLVITKLVSDWLCRSQYVCSWYQGFNGLIHLGFERDFYGNSSKNYRVCPVSVSPLFIQPCWDVMCVFRNEDHVTLYKILQAFILRVMRE